MTTVYSVSTRTDSPSTSLHLQKFFNNRFRPLSITEELSIILQSGPQPTDHLNRSLRYWQTTKMRHAKCSFAGIANTTCGSSRGKDHFFLLNKCVFYVKNHLRICNLSRTKFTEYDLILARAGKFNRSHVISRKRWCFALSQARSWYNYTGGQEKLSVSLSWP